jgi:hypothetical protein
VRPHFSHVSLVNASVLTLCRSTVWTVDSCWRRSDGKSVGLLLVTIVFEAVSVRRSMFSSYRLTAGCRIPDVLLTSIFGAAAFAHQDVLRIALRCRQEIATVGAEDKRSDGSHGVDLLPLEFLLRQVCRSAQSSDTRIGKKFCYLILRQALQGTPRTYSSSDVPLESLRRTKLRQD